MASRGVLFAIEADDELRLLSAADDDAVMAVIEGIEERWDKEWLCELDKAWDAIHRRLTNGKLEWLNGKYPLNHAVIGGRQLYEGDEYIVTYLDGPQRRCDVQVADPGAGGPQSWPHLCAARFNNRGDCSVLWLCDSYTQCRRFCAHESSRPKPMGGRLLNPQ